MIRIRTSYAARWLCAAVLLGIPGACAPAKPPAAAPAPAPAPDPGATIRLDGKYVVIDLDVNQLRFMDGDRVLWSAPVGTGTGFRLQTPGNDWKFTTPQGVMHVQFKELNPVWVAPDWYFIENRLPVPPVNSPLRKQPGGLGAAAVYLGEEIAIHGTDKPELLGRRVSHGCIRLSNANAARLFHNVQIGTPILLKGGPRDVIQEMPDSAAAFTRPKKGASARHAPIVNPLARVSTAQLLQRLDLQLRAADTTARWVATAGELVERGLRDDAPALRGLLSRAGKSGSTVRDDEYSTFLADAFARGSLRTVVSLNRIDEKSRLTAARAIVDATMDLYHGPFTDPLAPWPTRRVPKTRLGPEGQQGWMAMAAAEREYRDRHQSPVAVGGVR